MAIRMQNKKVLKKVILFAILGVFIVSTLNFLCSIHFRLDYYLFHFSIETSDFVEFKTQKENLEALIDEVDCFVHSTPNFFEAFNGECTSYEGGLVFYKKSVPYPNNEVFHEADADDWNDIRSCLGSFPDSGFGLVYLNPDYPEYIFFPAFERTPRVFVYTQGERPKALIDSYWEDYEYVEVIKLAHGWYDIRPIG